MERVQAYVLPCDGVGDVQDVLRLMALQPIDSERALKMMLLMFRLRAQFPLQFLYLDPNYIVFTNRWNRDHMLEYAEPRGEWRSESGWLYVIARHPEESADVFALLTDLVFAWISTWRDMCSPELAARMGHH